MDIKYAKFMRELWKLTDEIGGKGETDDRYAQVYMKLSGALNTAESNGLITYIETDEEDTYED